MNKYLCVLFLLVYFVGNSQTHASKNIYAVSVISPFDQTNNITEIRFNEGTSAMLTSKYLFEKFGIWTEVLHRDQLPILIWRNVKLYDDKNDLFNVAATGAENMVEMYSSIFITNSKGEDCLSEKSKQANDAISYFNKVIKNSSNKTKFYREYKKARSKN